MSAHVIEHLRFRARARRHPFAGRARHAANLDRDRPETSLAHVLADFYDGGAGTCQQGYEEHLRYMHPILTCQRHSEAEIQRQATVTARLWPKYGVHLHAWTRAGFEPLLHAALTSLLSGLSRQRPL